MGAPPATAPTTPPAAPPATYRLTRFVFLRGIGFIYFVAFLCAANQVVPLLGQHGLLPGRLAAFPCPWLLGAVTVVG